MSGENKGYSLSPESKFLEDQVNVEKTINFLEYLGGKGPYNPYQKTIDRLYGIQDGMRMAARAYDC